MAPSSKIEETNYIRIAEQKYAVDSVIIIERTSGDKVCCFGETKE